jgi:hypothetical protein
MEQSGKNRLVIHLLYANPIRRGATEVIEDLVALSDISVFLRCKEKPSKVYSAPSLEPLDFSYQDGRLGFVLPRLLMAAVVAVEF